MSNTTTIEFRLDKGDWLLTMNTITADSETLYAAPFPDVNAAHDAARDLATVAHFALVVVPGSGMYNVEVNPRLTFIEQDFSRTRVKPAPAGPAVAPSCDDQLDLWGDYPVALQDA